MKKIAYLLLAVLINCEYDPELSSNALKLPYATQTGRNTFGCLVNGKAWMPHASTDAIAFYQAGVLQISADISGGNDRGITMIVLGGLTQGASYDLANNPKAEAIIGWRNSSRHCVYDRNNTFSGQLTITKLDQVRYIISGLFEFKSFVSDCDTVRVTDGRFDFFY